MPEKVYYKEVGNETKVFELTYKNKLPLLLKGPTGCGKSRFVEAMAERVSRPLYTVVCNDETSAVDLLGRYIIKGTETVWQDGPVTRAAREGAILYLDEIAEAREDVLSVLHSLSDHRRKLFIDRHNEVVGADPNFMMIVSFNPGYQMSLKELKPSTRQRFVAIHFDYPSAEIEREIIVAESECDPKTVGALVKLSKKIRGAQELGLPETVSTRLLIQAGKLIRGGLHPREACESAVVEPLTDDRDTAKALLEMVSLHL